MSCSVKDMIDSLAPEGAETKINMALVNKFFNSKETISALDKFKNTHVDKETGAFPIDLYSDTYNSADEIKDIKSTYAAALESSKKKTSKPSTTNNTGNNNPNNVADVYAIDESKGGKLTPKIIEHYKNYAKDFISLVEEKLGDKLKVKSFYSNYLQNILNRNNTKKVPGTHSNSNGVSTVYLSEIHTPTQEELNGLLKNSNEFKSSVLIKQPDGSFKLNKDNTIVKSTLNLVDPKTKEKQYTPETLESTLINMKNGIYSDLNNLQTKVHEYNHAITAVALDDKTNNTPAKQYITKLYNEVLKFANANPDHWINGVNNGYWKTSVKEFTAEATSKIGMMRFLQAPISEKTKFLEGFKLAPKENVHTSVLRAIANMVSSVLGKLSSASTHFDMLLVASINIMNKEQSLEFIDGSTINVTENNEVRDSSGNFIHSAASINIVDKSFAKYTSEGEKPSVILNYLVKNHDNVSFIRNQAKLMLDLTKQFRVIDDGNFEWKEEVKIDTELYPTLGGLADYSVVTDAIRFKDEDSRSKPLIFLHEYAHGLSSKAIAYMEHAISNPSLYSKEKVTQFRNLIKVLDNVLAHSKYFENDVYAFKDRHEVLAEFMSNPYFREALANMPDKGYPLYMRIIRGIAELFGIPRERLFTQLDKVSTKIFEVNKEALSEITFTSDEDSKANLEQILDTMNKQLDTAPMEMNNDKVCVI